MKNCNRPGIRCFKLDMKYVTSGMVLDIAVLKIDQCICIPRDIIGIGVLTPRYNYFCTIPRYMYPAVL